MSEWERAATARRRLHAMVTASPPRFDASRADLVALLAGMRLDALLLAQCVSEERGARGVGAIELGVADALREVRRRGKVGE